MQRRFWIIALLCAAAGCRNEVETSLWDQVESLSEQKSELSLQVEQLRSENATLTERVQTLSAINPKTRIEAVNVPVTLRIGRHTGLFDKTADNRPDHLTVYLEPIDAAQDTVKAPGRMRVELWNLNAPPEQAKLATWEVGPEQLKQSWGRGLLGAYYRLTFPLGGVVTGEESALTVKAEFVDYLSGAILNDQKVITP